MTNKICYYYQTFVGLDKILESPESINTIIVSSIHFGLEKDGKPYIHLNDLHPDDSTFNTLWAQTKSLSENSNAEILIMMGGAGGAYEDLFSNYNIYYPMLVNIIKKRPWITGIDLDIEEQVSIDNVKELIRDLNRDFGDEFTINMAPLAGSLIDDVPGMGGFIYKELLNSKEGQYITRFNVQAYGSYTLAIFKAMVDNGYPANKLVLGMLSGQFNCDTFNDALIEIIKIKNIYPDFGGVFDWEFCNAPPDPTDPYKWAKEIKIALNTKPTFSLYHYIKNFIVNNIYNAI